MLATARSVLNSAANFTIEQQALGNIAGSTNGHCVITYEFFPANNYPDWLQELRRQQQAGISSILLREFNNVDNEAQNHVVSGNTVAQPTVVTDFAELNPPEDCLLINHENSTAILRAVRSREIPLVLVGDHPVAVEIAKQVAVLPITVTKIEVTRDLKPDWVDHLTPHSYVIIMTGDHELDFRFCQLALSNRTLKYVGCIGSNKKARLFHNRLKQQGASEEQLEKLSMPIGLAQINGKQTAVIAASIVAQIMSLHHW